MKKIVFTIDSNLPGGAERVTSVLASYFSKKEYEVTVINSDSDSSFYNFDDSVKIIKMGLDKSCSSSFKRLVLKYKFLYKYFKQNCPDVVITFLFHMELPTILAALRSKTKVFTSVRNSALSYSKITRLLRRILYPRIAGVIFQSEKVMSFRDFRNIKNKRVIMNPLSIPGDNTNPVSYENRKKWIINVGRLNKQKNQKLLIDAFCKISDEFPGFTLHIFGGGELKNDLNSYISSLNINDRVFLEGEVRDAIEINKDSYAFVLSSDYEGFPNVLAEAMSFGIPSISTDFDSGVASQLINPGDNGFISSVGDSNDLAEKMRLLLTLPPSQYNRIVDKSIKTKELLDVDIIGKQWEMFCFGAE